MKILAPRYKNLLGSIDEIQPEAILEIGTWAGIHAEAMIKRAQRHRSDVHYYGIDVFGEVPAGEGPNKKQIATFDQVKQRLDATGATVHLLKGNSTVILPNIRHLLPMPQLTFIDGGHSLSTIENDWNHAQRLTSLHHGAVVFDDYWLDRTDAGAKSLVDRLAADPRWKVRMLEPIDQAEDGRRIQMVRVERAEC